MSYINRIFFITATICLLAVNVVKAQETKNNLTWYNDINQAYELSQKTKKPIFAFFTGSDWCGWCHKLERAVFDKPGFQDWARKNVILLELDFPRNKQQPQKLVEQNQGLQQFFQVQGYPTVWIFFMNKDKTSGKFAISALGSLGYPQGQPGNEEADFLATATKIMNNKK